MPPRLQPISETFRPDSARSFFTRSRHASKRPSRGPKLRPRRGKSGEDQDGVAVALRRGTQNWQCCERRVVFQQSATPLQRQQKLAWRPDIICYIHLHVPVLSGKDRNLRNGSPQTSSRDKAPY